MTQDRQFSNAIAKRWRATVCTPDDPGSLQRSGASMGDLFERLPFELQSEIFIHAIPPLSPTVPHQSAILSQVCKTWRTLALSMPQIWSSFAFELPREEDISAHRGRQTVNHLKSWLERSRNYPLDFKLTQEHSIRARSQQQELGAVLLSALLAHSRRWRNVHLSIWNDDVAITLNGPTRFPLLRSLAISPTISTTLHPFSFTSFDSSWAQVSSIHLVNYQSPPPMDQILHILSQAPNIKNFTANMLCDSATQHHEVGEITLANLTELHIIFQYGSGHSHGMAASGNVFQNCLSFLAALDVKSLRSLRLQWDTNITDRSSITPNRTATQALVSFFRTIGSTLEELDLLYLPVGEETILGCFAHLDCLKDLGLKYSLGRPGNGPLNDSLLRRLTLPEHSQREGCVAVLPRLTTAKFEARGESLTVECLSRFVQSRMCGGDDPCGPRLEWLELFTELPLFDQLPLCLRDWEGQLDISSRIVRPREGRHI